MQRHGWYMRSVILTDGLRCRFGVFRFRCGQCGRTVSFLPDFCVPHKQFCADVVCAVLQAVLVLRLSARAVAAADSAFNAASFSRAAAGDWAGQFIRNSHNLRHFGLARLGLAIVVPSGGADVLLGLLLGFGAERVSEPAHSLRAVQCGLACCSPAFGVFRAQLLPGCVT
jgi:hypothetical protein